MNSWNLQRGNDLTINNGQNLDGSPKQNNDKQIKSCWSSNKSNDRRKSRLQWLN
uniref:Uncharacterized protein n=1 Tax=Rhizophora mucronata TaxID=61149 RepID=A0A2P2L5K0_RHIMU